MTPRRGAILALPALALAAVGAAVATTIGGDNGGDGARAAARSRAGTAVVSRRTLVVRQSVDGTLGYSGKRAATNRLSGTITWVPHTGEVIHPGGILFKVDAKPVVLMDGELPAYRTLRQGISDGRDVRQLERTLARLGFDPGAVDGHYDAATAAGVRAWQAHRGLERTGRVELGRVVFLPGARRVTDVKTPLGSTASRGRSDGNGSNTRLVSLTTSTTPTPTGPTTPDQTSTTPTTPKTPERTATTPTTPTTPAASSKTPSNSNGSNGNGSNNSDANAPATEVLTTSSTRRVVTAKLDAADQTLAARGRPVRVELPTGRVVSGRIVSVGSVATAASNGDGSAPGGGGGSTTIPITIRLRSAHAAGRLDEAPVSVQIARTTRRNVLAVPVQALVVRAGGSYAVERADGRLAAVTPGVFADGYVEIVDGAIREGDRIRVPR